MTDSKRLQLLLQWDESHRWTSCEEKRYCIICEETFSGREVRMSWFRPGVIRLRCPTSNCLGGPTTWVHPDNPLVSEEAWEDWDRIIRDSEAAAS